ncbi:MAG: cystathionine beta-lyase [Ktedonobacterales bacterium]
MDWRTKLIHPQVAAPEGFHSLVTPTYRGSTTLFPSAADVTDDWDQTRAPYSYGLYGTPTTFELAARLADLEGGTHCFLTPGGQAAISLIYFAFARAGGHVLLPESAYGPNRDLADRLLARLGIATEYYDPLIGGEIRTLIRDNTQLIWCENPGSVTMEVQDVPAITAAARQARVVTALDNTYAAGVLFDAFAHGVDVTMQALTKYVGGHSDLLLGSVTVRDPDHYQALGDAHQLLGMGVSPDDCRLALRGMQTLAVRLKQLEESTLAVARWFAEQPEVELVLHPALPTCPGHEFWQRDFSGSASVFSVVFAPGVPADAIIRFVDRLSLFKIGYSWGGVTSLAMPHFDLKRRYRAYGSRLVRFNIGLEAAGDLIADLEQGISAFRA